jgi:hypothetical protein
MNRRLFWLLSIIIACTINRCATAESEPEVNPVSVPFVRLLATPESYDGKIIVVYGFLHQRFEDSAIYSSKENADYLIDCIWIRPRVEDKARIKKLDGQFVMLVGTFSFDKGGNGHLGVCRGELKDAHGSPMRRYYDGRIQLPDQRKFDGRNESARKPKTEER